MISKRFTPIYVVIGIATILAFCGLWWFAHVRGKIETVRKVYKTSSHDESPSFLPTLSESSSVPETAADSPIELPEDPSHPSGEGLSVEEVDRLQDSQRQTEEALQAATEQAKMIDPEIKAKLEKLFTPSLLSEQNIKNVFSEKFSLKRLNHASETLNRYGPEEGLRRLQKEDPEIAKQVGRLISRKPPQQESTAPPE